MNSFIPERPDRLYTGHAMAVNLTVPLAGDAYLKDVFSLVGLGKRDIYQSIDYKIQYTTDKIRLIGLSAKGSTELLNLALEEHKACITRLAIRADLTDCDSDQIISDLVAWYESNRPRLTITSRNVNVADNLKRVIFGTEYSQDCLTVYNRRPAIDLTQIATLSGYQDLPKFKRYGDGLAITWQVRGEVAQAALNVGRAVSLGDIEYVGQRHYGLDVQLRAMFCAITNSLLEPDYWQAGGFEVIKLDFEPYREPPLAKDPELFFSEALDRLYKLVKKDRKEFSKVVKAELDKRGLR